MKRYLKNKFYHEGEYKSKGVPPNSEERASYKMDAKGGTMRTVKSWFFLIKLTVQSSFN